MKKLPTISRADLLREFLDPAGLDDNLAILLGYERKTRSAEAVQGNNPDQSSMRNNDTAGELPPQPPEPAIEFPTHRPSLKFLMPTWASQAVILRDDTWEMYPFSQDVDALCRRLRRERGGSGLKIVSLRNVPGARDISRIPCGTPILAISAMGQFTENVAARQAWQKLSRRLVFRDHRFSALNPCPQNRWEKELADSWPTAVWDRGQRLPRRGGMNAIPKVRMTDKTNDTVEHLLNLLSPASLVEPALLRQARLLLGRTADAGTEWDAWHHADCWQSMNCFGLRSGDAWNDRLQHRLAIAISHPALVAGVARAIREQHKTCSEGIAAEAELRSCLSGQLDEAAMDKIQQFFSRVIDRLRQLAEEPGSNAGERSGLPAWFADLVERLSPEIRQHEAVQESIAEVWHSHTHG